MHVFNVQGMTCGHCSRAVTQAVQALDPHAQVKVDLAGKQVSVESGLDAEQVLAAIREEGYEAQSL
ncbi:MAG TPA: cation transporter [Pseudomonas sp.]|uniref:heavy-metal-associated domain-containing protein n=1 Tax=Pseudomonas sp. TaxID=306 RepID=UPI002B48E149|nr:cation transporter [Pseudomonas sp.]HKS14561.1 cation transporter [Pseudomonas sp.]